jgi:rhodanese-related sulfurtransferase
MAPFRAAVVAVLMLGGLLDMPAAQAQDTVKIDQAALLKRIQGRDDSMILLDVRAPEEFAAGHLPGAVNIPYAQLPARISELPSAAHKDIVVYCTSGARSEQAIQRFRDNGYTRLLHLEGDLEAWQAGKLPTEQ